MIEYRQGDIFESGADLLVNPVNCKGIMGAGLALQFKKRFPENYAAYRQYCLEGKLKPGGTFVFESIVNLATKDDWRKPSQLEWIESGLASLSTRSVLLAALFRNPYTVALPALGCGHGGLKWEQVKPMIEIYFRRLKTVTALVYEP